MSKGNITNTEHLPNGKVRLTFDTGEGTSRVYEFSGSSARAVKRGTDPSQLMGRLIKPKKK